jgi:signal transduction histidine kinase
MLRSTIPTSVEIQEDVADDLHAINGDATQINQILLNLSTNASHSMKEAGGTLTVTVANTHVDQHSAMDHPGLAPGNHVRLTISDTGHGIKPELMEKIFDPYFTTKEIDEGTGMGLAVVHGIVKNHGGAISVDSWRRNSI